MRRLIGLGSCLLLGAAAFCVSASAQTFAGDISVKDLRYEFWTNPIGMDVMKPRLSWVLESPKRAQVQSAYRILVASSEENLKADKGDLWDTGKVESDRSIQVEYAGKPLESRMRCWWKVRVWDKDGKESPWSEPAWWEMGLLKEGHMDHARADWLERRGSAGCLGYV